MITKLGFSFSNVENISGLTILYEFCLLPRNTIPNITICSQKAIYYIISIKQVSELCLVTRPWGGWRRSRGSILGIGGYIMWSVPTGHWNLIIPLLIEHRWRFSWRKNGLGREYIYLHPVLKLRMSGSIPPGPICLHDLTGHKFTFTFAIPTQVDENFPPIIIYALNIYLF